MVQTVIIYSLIPIISIFFATNLFKDSTFFVFNKHINLNFPLILSISLISLVFGMRYKYFGIDYEGYVNTYINIKQDFTDFDIEFGYLTLNYLFNYLNIHYAFFFVFLTFIILVFIYKGFQKYHFIFPYLIFFIFSYGFIFDTTNIIRHSIAFSIFVFSIQFIYSREFLKYFFFIMLAFLFHKSALILLPLYFFIHYNIFKYNSTTILLLIFFFFFNTLSDLGIQSYITRGLSFLNYDKYLSSAVRIYELSGMWRSNTGMGFILFTVIDLFMIVFYSNKLKQYFPIFKIFYNIFILGLVFSPLTIGIMVLYRINYYFISMRMVVMSFFLCYLINSKKSINYLIALLIIIIYLLAYISRISSPYSHYIPFKFFFQE